MIRAIAFGMRLAAMVAALAVAAAISSPGADDAVAATPVPALSYVAVGDSIAVWNDQQSYPADYRAYVATDLQSTVTLTNLAIGGRTSADLLDLLRTSDAYRTAIPAADLLTWTIGINDLTTPRAAYKAGTCGGADNQDCLRVALADYQANLDSLIAEIRTLNPKPTLILRMTDVYYPWRMLDTADGSEQVLRSYAVGLNGAILSVGAAKKVPVASVFAVFNGTDGSLDPNAGGYLAPDGLHPSAAGSAAIANALRRTMYEPLAHDGDGDGVVDQVDNCPTVANPGQENHDANFVDLKAYGKMYNDVTWPNSDNLGDACDSDADNDGLPNAIETAFPIPWCPSATGPTDPLLRDTDGDGVLDAAECALGTDPVNANSKPPLFPAGDSDHDGLSDSFELQIGTDPYKPDTDGDGVLDGAEYKNYNTNPLMKNSDGDLCSDGKEVASVNADTKVNSTDLQLLMTSFTSLNVRYILDFDLNKDGKVNSTDLLIGAHLYGYCV
jgi:lysophospholipase L1-like esterase